MEKHDAVNSPSHYTAGGIETIDYIKAKLTPEQYEGYLLGNVIKYTSRYQYKNGMEDLKKGSWYMKRLQDQPAKDKQPTRPTFKKGDKVKNKNGSTFSNGQLALTVDRVDMFERAWFRETCTHSRVSGLELVPAPDLPLVRINDLCKAAYQNAVDKGWYEEPRTFGDAIALMHSELSEALEDYRAGKGFKEVWYEGKNSAGMPMISAQPITSYAEKPCGVLSELADTVIRIFDLCGHHGADLEGMIAEKMAYNATRPKRHGGKTL